MPNSLRFPSGLVVYLPDYLIDKHGARGGAAAAAQHALVLLLLHGAWVARVGVTLCNSVVIPVAPPEAPDPSDPLPPELQAAYVTRRQLAAVDVEAVRTVTDAVLAADDAVLEAQLHDGTRLTLHATHRTVSCNTACPMFSTLFYFVRTQGWHVYLTA